MRDVVARMGRTGPPLDRKRLLLLAVAALISVAAALAIGILLFGDFGATEGRILATTALLAGYALLALPAAVLRDQKRLGILAAAVVALAVTGAALAVATVWSDEPPDALGQAMGTVTVWLVASAQTSALAAWLHGGSGAQRRLFVASSGLALVVAAMVAALIWGEIDSERYARALAALVVLDVLTVALQPILARARPSRTEHRLRIVVVPGETVELSVEAADLASAAATAIRTLERQGRRVLLVDTGGGVSEPSGADAARRSHEIGAPGG